MSLFFEPEAEAGPEPAPAAPPRRLQRWLRRAAVVLVAVVVVVGAAAGLYAGAVSRSFTTSVHRQDLLPHPTASASGSPSVGGVPATPPRPARGSTKALNVALLGSDSRDAANTAAGRSDTLMLLHLQADRRRAYLISFPRDMFVTVPGYGKNKINAAYSFGGVPLAVETLEQLLGTPMDHAAVIDFDGFIALTEQLGGVTVHNKHASQSRGYTFPAGEITVSGDEALAYVRERYDLPNGDLDRAERQRDVVRAILRKGLRGDTIANPAKFSRFVSGVGQHLTVDNALTDREVRRTALSLRLGPDDVVPLQAPIAGFGTANGQSIDVVDHDQLAELGRALAEDTMQDYVQKHPAR